MENHSTYRVAVELPAIILAVALLAFYLMLTAFQNARASEAFSWDDRVERQVELDRGAAVRAVHSQEAAEFRRLGLLD